MTQEQTIYDTLTGKQAVKMEISIDTKSMVYLGLALFIAIVLGSVVGALTVKNA